MSVYLAGLAAAWLHFVFFLVESVFWRKTAWKVFRIPAEQSELPSLRLFAFNMGFYNLFLSMGMLAGLVLQWQGCPGGRSLVTFVGLSMVGAGLVLLVSRKRLLGPLIQAGPAAYCLWSLWH